MSEARLAVFPIAGYGSRFLPATKAIPKAMLPVLDKPLIQYAVEEARAAGIEHYVFVTGAGREAVAEHFESQSELSALLEARGQQEGLAAVEGAAIEPGAVSFVSQPDPLGLGHAVWCARRLVGEEPFVVILSDVLRLDAGHDLRAMVALQAERGGNVIAVSPVPPDQVSRYGILDAATGSGRVRPARGVAEKPAPADAPSDLAVVGRYVLDAALFRHLEGQAPGRGGEVQLSDALDAAAPELPLTGYVVDGFFDCGEPAGMLAANIAAGLRRADLRAEVQTILDRANDTERGH